VLVRVYEEGVELYRCRLRERRSSGGGWGEEERSMGERMEEQPGGERVRFVWSLTWWSHLSCGSRGCCWS
jgi:hypothetical protein